MYHSMANLLQMALVNISYYSQQYFDRYSFLMPLGLIGIWRWSVWLIKEILGLGYKPKTEQYGAKVSLVIPVYNENPQVFSQALESWKANNPTEIIAVIDYTDHACIEIFKNFIKVVPNAKLIVTKTPGKRPALADGIRVAKSEIVALVDSDTIWDKDVLRYGLSPFKDKKVAGVATYQSVLNPKTFAEKVFDIQLDLRYRHEYPFLAACGNALVCLSGRTAFYRRDVITPMLPDLVDERFMGVPVISGDDKRLTYLVLAAGWKVAYQSNSHVYTPGMEKLGQYLKQRLRWTRNSLRADIAAISNGWPLRHPALLFFQIDKFLQGFVVILSPIFFLVSIYSHFWIAALIIVTWWLVSRTVKLYNPYLSHNPQNITLIPGYILYTFLAALLKIYAFFTLNTQGWITRWDKSRMPRFRFLLSAPAYLASLFIVLSLTYGVYIYKEKTYIIPHIQKREQLANALPVYDVSNTVVLGASTAVDQDQKDLFTIRYQARVGDSFASLSRKFGVDVNQLYYANMAKSPNGHISPGSIISVPGGGIHLKPDLSLIRPATGEGLNVIYDKTTNTLVVSARGKQITLSDIKAGGGANYLEEVSPKIWLAKATIFVTNGTTLKLNSDEVTWLKLKSDKEGFVNLRALNSDIVVNKVRVTSWDLQNDDYDRNLNDGRSFVMVKDNSRMDIYSSEMAFLGYPTSSNIIVSPYGVSWKLSRSKLKTVLLGGEVIDSKFHDNYFGAYTYGATGMLWRGNEFYSNIRYGLDPHDDSSGFLVENNSSHDNGSHGIIFSKRCKYNVIRNNISYNNKLHGIMLHEESDFNVIEGNVLTGNVSGVSLYHSSNNLVQDNTIRDNRHGIRANVGADNNKIQNNLITNSKMYGIYFYEDANSNAATSNSLASNDVGIYIRSNSNVAKDNKLTNNRVGLYLQDKASGNFLDNNEIKYSGMYGIYTKVSSRVNNLLGQNDLYRNRKDIVGVDRVEE